MDDWTASNIKHRDFKHSDRQEDWEETKHRRKARKGCKKSKDGLHDFSKIIKKWLSLGGDYYWTVVECSKCGKHDWKTVTPP
jgi:hypothetical protein